MKKNLKFLLMIGIVLLVQSSFSAWAEDDDEREDDEEERQTSETATSPVAETKTYQTTAVTLLKDSDGDGLLDRDDPHPETAEIYIVEDNNLNGIVDQFEK